MISQLLVNLPILGPDRLGAGARRLPPEALERLVARNGMVKFLAMNQAIEG